MKPARLQIAHREVQPGVAVIAPAGKVMLGVGTAFIEDLVHRAARKGGACRIVVDLSGVTHIDGAAVRTFMLAIFGKVRQAGGELVMAGAGRGEVREGFRVTRLDSVFHYYPDVESAVGALSKPAEVAL